MAVTEDVYRNDARDCMHVLLQLYADPSTADEDDNIRQYIFQAWGRIASVMKADFVPFLPTIMPVVFNLANVDPKLDYLGKLLL